MILLPDKIQHNNPAYPTLDVDSIEGIHRASSIAERDGIPIKKRRAGPSGSVVFINGSVYQYKNESIADADWEDIENWEENENIIDSTSWEILEIAADIVALPFKYYLVNASSAPVTITIPIWAEGNIDEYYIKLDKDTHKVTTTDGSTNWIVPTCGGSLHIKGGETGWKVVHDNSGFSKYVVVSENRDFSDGDGFENNVTYACLPSVSGEGRIFTLPTPKTYSDSGSIKAVFSLIGEGTLTVLRSDGGDIGGVAQQVISTPNKAFTLQEANGEYIIVQDSRQNFESVITLPLYRLDEASDIAGFNSMAQSKDDIRYGAEVEEVSPIIDGVSFVNIKSYISDLGLDLGLVPKSEIRALTSIKLTNVPSSTFVGIKVYYEYAYCDPDGTNVTNIVNSSQYVITTNAYSQVNIETEFPETDLTGKRFIVRVWAAEVSAAGTANSLTVKIEGGEGAKYYRIIAGTLSPESTLPYKPAYRAEYIDANADTLRSFDPAVELGGEYDYAIVPVMAVCPITGTIYQTFRVADSHLTDDTDLMLMQKSSDGGITWTDLIGGADNTFTTLDIIPGNILETWYMFVTDTGRIVMFGREITGELTLVGQRITYSDDGGLTWSVIPSPPWSNTPLGNSVARGENGEYLMVTLDTDNSSWKFGIYESTLSSNGLAWTLRSYAYDNGAIGAPYLSEPYIQDFGGGTIGIMARYSGGWSYTTPSNMNVPALLLSRDYGRTWGGASSDIGNPIVKSELDAGVIGHATWLPLEGEGVSLGDNTYTNCLPLVDKITRDGEDYILIPYYNRITDNWRVTVIHLSEWILRGKYAIRTDIYGTIIANTAHTRDDGNGAVYVAKGNGGFLWTTTNATTSTADVSILVQGYFNKASLDTIVNNYATGTRYS